MSKRLAVLTSGGDAPGMNAVIRAVVRAGIYHGFEVLGVDRGYYGLIHSQFHPMNANSVAGVIHQGGTVLKTARSEEFKTPEGFAQAVKNLREFAIDGLVVVGGDGSMEGAMKLAAEGIKTTVVPATIDNDMPATDYTIGFDTALNTVLDAVSKIRDTAESHERVAVIEVMGRHAGHIALMAGLASGAEIVLLPELPLAIDDVCEQLQRTFSRGKLYSIVMVAEGVGNSFAIAKEISERTGFRSHVTVLGYIQRGGRPTATDNIIGSQLGAAAVEYLADGPGNCLVAWQKSAVTAVPFDELGNHQRGIDRKLFELTGMLAM